MVNDVGECAMGSGVKKLSSEERGFLRINEEIFDDLTRRNLSLHCKYDSVSLKRCVTHTNNDHESVAPPNSRFLMLEKRKEKRKDSEWLFR